MKTFTNSQIDKAIKLLKETPDSEFNAELCSKVLSIFRNKTSEDVIDTVFVLASLIKNSELENLLDSLEEILESRKHTTIGIIEDIFDI